MRFSSSIALSIAIASALMSPGCTTDSPYFGKSTPRTEQRLVFAIGGEPVTLDPGKTPGGYEERIIPALFEGLTGYHPSTLEPMAALATHYEANGDNTQFTFYLRGHPDPQGIKLPNTDTLRQEYVAGKLREDFSRGCAVPPDRIPARWSDGRTITAHDFVYSWRRVLDPQTASPMANDLFCVKQGETIAAGRHPPEDLAVRALDEFTLQVELRAPTPLFVKLTEKHVFAPVPRQAIKAAQARGRESSWTEPAHLVTSGAFTLREWQPHDRIVVVRSPTYYERDLVALQEIRFVPVVDSTTTVNLYKVGEIDAMPGDGLPELFLPALARARDFHSAPAFHGMYYAINIKKPPLDNVLLRYALNMATNKTAIAGFMDAGRIPARQFVPPVQGYEALTSLPVTVQGQTYDVLSYNPEAARDLLAQAGFPRGKTRDGHTLNIEALLTTYPFSRPIGEILQQQWRKNLNISVTLVTQEFTSYIHTLLNRYYNGVSESDYQNTPVDPNAFLEPYVTGSPGNDTGWTDVQYDAMLAQANATADPAMRMKKLAECEMYLLKAMPIVPLFFYSWAYLQKPFVHGLVTNPLDAHRFKYVWIDTNWTPEAEREQVSRK